MPGLEFGTEALALAAIVSLALFLICNDTDDDR